MYPEKHEEGKPLPGKQDVSESFQPYQWWFDDLRNVPCSAGSIHAPEEGFREVYIMWVYREVQGVWIVGFWSPDKEWHTESTHLSKEQAAARVHWLNGGNGISGSAVAQAAERGYRG